MMQNIAYQWQAKFWQTLQQPENAEPLKQAALKRQLGKWTTALTTTVVSTSTAMGWQSSAKGHPLGLFPVSPSEYLALDVMSFSPSDTRWRFPIAVMELENSSDINRSAYSLWKVLCVRAALRIVFCYRRSAEERASPLTFLRNEVLQAISLADRMKLDGETLVVVGSRDDSATFPYGFFKWWQLETNTGKFGIL
ncbi:hypothetical protein [Umezakia ovalisporum]|uniref:Uncharacterized protein n=1 Tax=Umezakia ovalisporum FSS-62 TaxID=2971776 RepID=A0AA43KEZ1_9CYAN|nr:hypothetical protein [Umezakia ovalisporum]MDH6063433.1 hypothetical protein [Umezakia ovalisporum FSS-62]MDH6103381.1 hypothetical protein [Umezakia ovalisporum ANA283AFssAo]